MNDSERFQNALTAFRNGEWARAEQDYRHLLRRLPNEPSLYVNLAAVRRALGHREEAVDLLKRALELAPEHTNACSQLGLAYAELGRLTDAESAYNRALQLDANHLGALNNLALLNAAQQRFNEAFELYRRALAVEPTNPATLQNMGALLTNAGRLADAEACLRAAIVASPDDPGSHVNLANVLTKRGRAKEALPLLTKGIIGRPTAADWHSNLLLTLHYLDGPSQQELFAEHLRWARIRTGGLIAIKPHQARTRGKKLRIGYVSPDFKSHAVAFFIAPLLRGHDRSRFEVYAYANVQVEDATTARLRAACDSSCNVFALGDDALADRIRADSIDVLVDLAGHTAGNRLLAFAHEPAPVQLTYLGYPDTSGMAAVGFRVTDSWCDPPENEAFYSEKLLYMEGGLHCYEPPADAPPVARAPALSNGHLTFGSFNNTAKITETVIARWASLLRSVPDARMHMKFTTLADPTTAAQYREWFARYGVAPGRLTLLGGNYDHGAHLAEHAAVDVILDAFPYHGTTTTCEALWMGVPVLSLIGQAHVARVALSLLHQVGLERFAVNDEATLIERACYLATPSGRADLALLRGTLRARMAASPLCDAAAKSRAIEACYETAFARFEVTALQT